MNDAKKTTRMDTYPGGDDQMEMDEIELDDSPFCECGNDPYEEEAASGICSACGKELA